MSILIVVALLAAVELEDSPDLRCIVSRMPTETRSALLDESLANRGQGPATDALVAAAVACREQLGWDNNEAGLLGSLAHSYITGERARDRLESGGLDAGLITAWFDALPRSAQTDMVITDATMARLSAHLRSSGVTQATIDAQAPSIGAFYASLVLIERIGAGLPLE